MEGELSYFDLAENDYLFIEASIKENRVFNMMCYASQNICEKYLKHVIVESKLGIDTTKVLHTHSINTLYRFIETNIKEFTGDWDAILKTDNYYYTTRYPDIDTILVDERDVIKCWNSVLETRNAVVKFINTTHKENVISTEDIVQKLKKELEDIL